MKYDIYGQCILTENDICDLLLQDQEKTFKQVLSEEYINIAKELEIPNINIKKYVDTNVSIEEFDNNTQKNWYMPDNYKNMDIAKWVLEQCKTDVELQRVGKELILFQERNMFDLLKYLKFLVDTMKENNIIYGVGRGSSVSSFVLYIIGIHRINSLYYDLDIEEFLK